MPPGPLEVKKKIDAIAKDAKSDASKRHLRIKESAFVNKYVIPFLFDQMKAETSPEVARKSLLSESWRSMREHSEASPARGRRHPFGKLLGTKPPAIMKQWKGEAGVALTQPCPDFALCSPFPKIVFEAKYFPKGDRAAAESALVTGIYQAFFYRALPFIPASKSRPAWDYDYACLLVYDGSEKGSLTAAWNSINDDTQKAFWESAAVYVMVLRGK